ncbi:aminotransferase-like domain-containing protein [Cupriavidus pinatubonensis]|uniref:2-aminoadipate transaminase n=1 Tax=Cupriavidus pinatubonensis TaxID=248026 RepID=A0ABN7ZG82_9BURK|nr:PLP-dependent aminotransferase family protein [Cupriavidus pinatubonensis]CAG9184982.1 2-aminoadipate transaminase [Cupriavidus pinatubonensis]
MSITFSQPFAEPKGSPIRELFPYLSLPGMISFAGGYPSPSLFDSEGLRDAAAEALTAGGVAFQYGSTEGDVSLREQLSALMAHRGLDCPSGRILVTTGSQQAFDIVVRVLMNRGDVAYVETPAYPATIQALALAGTRIVQVPVDSDGLNVATLEEMLRAACPKDRPKILYTVPTFSNPCGTRLSLDRRERLVQLALEFEFVIVEDDPYSELAFTDERLLPIYAVASRCVTPEQNPVVYLSSLSKTVAPALRIGWMVASPAVLRRSAIAKQTMDLCTSPVSQAIAASYLASGRYPATVASACAEYGRRMSTMATALQSHLGNRVQFDKPTGGMFLWGRMGDGIDPTRVFKEAVDLGVVYVPGHAFYASNPDANTFRFSYAAPDCKQIETGVARFAEALEKAGSALANSD